MNFIYSDEILKEFIRLSEQQKENATAPIEFDKSQFDLISNTNNDLIVDGPPTFVTAAFVSNAADDAKTILEKKYPMEPEDMIEKAHPETCLIAEHPHNGGVVENQNEQHQKIVNVVNKMPTGFPLNSWASITTELIKIAQECDDLGLESEAKVLDGIAKSFFLVEAAPPRPSVPPAMPNWTPPPTGYSGFMGGLLRILGPTAFQRLGPVLTNPWVAGIAAALAVGTTAFFTLWDGMEEGLTTDIKDFIDKLDNYKKDPSFSQLSGLQEMYDAALSLQSNHQNVAIILGNQELMKTADGIAQAGKLLSDIDNNLKTLEQQEKVFESSAEAETGGGNIMRMIPFVGFHDLSGRIVDLREEYAKLRGAHPEAKITPQDEHSKTSPATPGANNPGTSAPGTAPVLGNAADIKRFLKERDVSEIVGYEYDIDDSPEFDATTRRVLSDLGDHIREQLGTSTPSTKELMDSSYNGLEKLMQIYHEPWNFTKAAK